MANKKKVKYDARKFNRRNPQGAIKCLFLILLPLRALEGRLWACLEIGICEIYYFFAQRSSLRMFARNRLAEKQSPI